MNLSAFSKAANAAGIAVFAVEFRIIDYIGIKNFVQSSLLDCTERNRYTGETIPGGV
jgi:hypothetical protein